MGKFKKIFKNYYWVTFSAKKHGESLIMIISREGHIGSTSAFNAMGKNRCFANNVLAVFDLPCCKPFLNGEVSVKFLPHSPPIRVSDSSVFNRISEKKIEEILKWYANNTTLTIPFIDNFTCSEIGYLSHFKTSVEIE